MGAGQKQLRQERLQLQALQQRFALVESRAVLETCRRDVQAQRMLWWSVWARRKAGHRHPSNASSPAWTKSWPS